MGGFSAELRCVCDRIIDISTVREVQEEYEKNFQINSQEEEYMIDYSGKIKNNFFLLEF